MSRIALDERRKINHQLKKLGFGGLEDRNIFSQIATLYRTHESFRGLLMSTMPDQRRIAYESLRPHLCFVPKSLEEYEREVKEKAEREQWDVWNGTAYPDQFKVGEIETEEYRLKRVAEEAIQQDKQERESKGHLILTCPRCTFEQVFPGASRVEASMLARETGWTLVPKPMCPKCSELFMKVQ